MTLFHAFATLIVALGQLIKATIRLVVVALLFAAACIVSSCGGGSSAVPANGGTTSVVNNNDGSVTVTRNGRVVKYTTRCLFKTTIQGSLDWFEAHPVAGTPPAFTVESAEVAAIVISTPEASPNFRFNLTDAAGKAVAESRVDSKGFWHWVALPPGTYKLSEAVTTSDDVFFSVETTLKVVAATTPPAPAETQ